MSLLTMSSSHRCRIIAAADSFKGCLSAVDVCTAIHDAVVDVLGSDVEVCMMPLSDGGEGFCSAVVTSLGGTQQHVLVHDPLMRPIDATYGVVSMSAALFGKEDDAVECAVVELAKASGLCLLTADERNPWTATTFGTGELIRQAITDGYRHILVGLGGSATNDCGRGLLEALEGTHQMENCHFLVATDVDSPLCGPHGATYVFAHQKGAGEEMLALLEQRNASFGRMLNERCGHDVTTLEGAGAAGGAGSALFSLPHCRRISGIELMLQLYPVDDEMSRASMVITGEGCLDAQTLMGKAPYGIAVEAQRYHVPCVALGGRARLSEEERLCSPWTAVVEVTPPDMDDMQALLPDIAKNNIYEAVKKYLRTK